MSTILDALEKHKGEQIGNRLFVEQIAANSVWKFSLLVLLLIVIVLLAFVIYLLPKPPEAAREPIEVAPAMSVQQEKQQTPVITLQKTEMTIEKINFKVNPLPKLPMLTEVKQTEQQVRLVNPTQIKQVATHSKAMLSSKVEGAAKNFKEKEINYSDTSSALKKRFQSALLMNDALDARIIEDENINFSDGSDIHQMASKFQSQVPSLRYDFHMYSSIVKDRWIRINNEDLKEGQFTSSGKIQLVEIQPNRSVFRLGRQSFSLESLTDWKGY